MQDHLQQAKPSLQNSLIKKILRDPQVYQFFIGQLEPLPKDIYEVNVTFQKIYIAVFPEKHLEELQPQRLSQSDVHSKYVIKINRSFPLAQSVRVHLIDGAFLPKVSDSRDLMRDILGKEYDYTVTLEVIIMEIIKFDRRLQSMTEDYRGLQRVGQFVLGETFYYHQLSELYSSLTLLKDHSPKKTNTYLGLTDTHLLFFRELIDKNHMHSSLRHHHSLLVKNQKELCNEQEATLYKLRLVSYGELQCIQNILYRESDKTVRLTIKKFKNVKSYREVENIQKQYKLHNPAALLRGILKSITKFQPCEIELHPNCVIQSKKSNSRQPSKQQQTICQLISKSARLQYQLKFQTAPADQKAKVVSLSKLYQKIIEYYSARANPYYLIFVNKVNNVYQHYCIASNVQKKQLVVKDTM